MAVAQEEKQAGVPEWVVTFGDMMSLLLTFFIMLFSMSEIKQDKLYQAMMEALRQRFGYDTSMVNMVPGSAKPRDSALAKVARLGRAQRANTLSGGDKVKAPAGDHPRVTAIRQADHLTAGGLIVFPEGSADLTDKHKRILESVAQEIGGKPQRIVISGHTSTKPLPPDSPYKTHWHLAFQRSLNVKDFLVKLGIDPKRIRLAAAAENEPKHVRPDPLLLKENPRVEVFMTNELAGSLPGGRQGQQGQFSGEGGP